MISTKEMSLKERRRFWLGHIKRWRASGLGKKAYCEQENLNHHSLTYWIKKYPQQHTSQRSKDDGGRLRQVQINGEGRSCSPVDPAPLIQVKFADCTVTLEGRVDEESLAAVFRAARSL